MKTIFTDGVEDNLTVIAEKRLIPNLLGRSLAAIEDCYFQDGTILNNSLFGQINSSLYKPKNI